jgi:hypothetical protein
MAPSKIRRHIGVVLALLATSLSPSVALAQAPTPPAIGPVVMEESFAEAGLVRPFDCVTGRGGFHYAGEGLRMRLSGRCHDSHPFAITGPLIRGLSLADGEVRIEVKAVDAVDRVRFAIQARRQPGAGVNRDALAAGIEPALGRAFIAKASGAETGYLAERADLANKLAPDDWNSLAFRLRGPELWLLVNDEPVLYTSEGALDRAR